MTTISWTHNPATGGRGATWNPVTGCSAVSTGCLHCYSVVRTRRLATMHATRDKYGGLVSDVHFTGEVRCHEDVLEVPLKRKKPTTFFVNSMSDTFHEKVPFEFIDKLFAVMALCPQHVFQCLSKRPERMAEYLEHNGYASAPGGPMRDRVDVAAIKLAVEHNVVDADGTHPAPATRNEVWPFPNVWLGVSVENQAACVRIEDLLRCPATVRFVSFEPLLEDIAYPMDGLDWVIIGGESGPKARPLNFEWVYDLIDQCQAANVPVFVKQIGSCARLQGEPYPRQHPDDRGKRTDPRFWPKPLQIQEYPQR